MVVCLCFMGSASAQWVVSDPGNLAQGIINTAKQIVETAGTKANTLNGFLETQKIFQQGKAYYDYSLYNACRLPSFGQLDLRIDKTFYFERCMLGLYVDLQNVTMSKLRSADALMSTGIIENPDAPAEQQRYRMKSIRQESGSLVPTLGITVEF